jgi:hypothetical protein
MCPTRELANQVAVEARKLLKYHRSLGVQVVIGGTRLPQEQRSMKANPCQVVIMNYIITERPYLGATHALILCTDQTDSCCHPWKA